MAPRKKSATSGERQYSHRPIMGKNGKQKSTPSKRSRNTALGRDGRGQRYSVNPIIGGQKSTASRNSGKPVSYGRDIDSIRSYHGVGKVNKKTVGTALKRGGKRMAKEGLEIAKEEVMPVSVDTKKGTITASETLGGPGVRMGLAAARGMGLPAPHPPEVYGRFNYKNPLQSKVGMSVGGEDFGISAGGAIKKGGKAIKNVAHSISHHLRF